MLDQASLPADLGGDVIVRESCGREQGDLLPSGNGVHGIDGGDAGLDHLLRVGALCRVDGGPVDVQEGLSQDLRPTRT